MQIVNSRKRKAISPVLATVILIAITLIAAIAIAGFVFGLFGTFTNNAQVSVTAVSVSNDGATYTLRFQNSGTIAATVNSVTITYGSGGATHTASCTPAAANSVPPGGQLVLMDTGPNNCDLAVGGLTAFPGVVGAQFSGSASLSNGGQALLSGTFS